MQFEEDWKIVKGRVAKIQNENRSLGVPPVLVAMLVAAEDHRYGSHPGVDLISICRAAWRSVFCGKREGGSTIAMQLVRVITGRYERTLVRKITEIYLAIRLTRYLCDDELPKLYLVVAYFGWKMNGLAQASQRLKIDLVNISDLEAANIVARLKYPEPQRCDEKRLCKIQERVKYILIRADALSLRLQRQFELSEANGSF
ncbi:MAG: biosynthetic peptidoglycan transglycosylase [Pseudomonadota bacterium]